MRCSLSFEASRWGNADSGDDWPDSARAFPQRQDDQRDRPGPEGIAEHGVKENALSHLSHAPRCGAKTKGGPCPRPPLPGRKRCRLHGGLSPGAPRGSQNGNYKNGEWTAEAIAERRWL